MTQPALQSASTGAQPSADIVLQATGLSKTYAGSGILALDSLDLFIAKGEIFGLLGPNGAGKTTAIAVMSTLLRPSAGRVAVCGLDSAAHTRLIRRRIGVVSQHIALYDRLSARENLTYFASLYGLSGSARDKAVDMGLAMAGMTERADDAVKGLSGGMKRRVNLSAGVLHRPELLFLDEPTVGVDAQSRNLIFEKLLELKQQGTAMIYTTHYFEEAELLCDRIAILDCGRVLVQGPCQRLIGDHGDCGNLSDLFLKLTGRQLRD